ncbi:MAG TPA: hypothetical protein PLV21_14070 [Cyclobacteriaceae bacterium]|nr:hypothetical protein [Cyclobacteriaceae bacterium]HRJ83012.1 hypothetical protein [Cyclobacteriaceae bacterium]
MEIVSYFTQVLSIEIFIKGFFFSICLSLGLFMILSDQRSYFNDVHNFKSYRDKLRLLIQNYFKKITIAGFLSSNNDPLNKWNELRFPLIVNSLTFGILFFVAALVFGSLIHSISHKWISYESKFHLGLKDFWNPASLTRFYSLFNQECDEKGMKRANTNDLLKVKSFCDIFGDISSLEMCNSSNGCFEIKEIKEIYYRARHELLTKDVWREYLLSTEKLVGISESFAFSFYILFWALLYQFLY